MKINEGFKDFEIEEEALDLIEEPEENILLKKKLLMRRVFYMYNFAKLIIIKHIYPRFRYADSDNNDRGRLLFLFGDYNVGKSHLFRFTASLLKKKFMSYWKLKKNGVKTHPIVIFNLSDTINTANQLYIFLLTKLGNPVDSKIISEWRKSEILSIQLLNRVIETLKSYETRLLILDEAQRFLKSRNPDIPNIFEAFKDLTTKDNWKGAKLRTHIILCGTNDGLLLFRQKNVQFIHGRVHTEELKEISDVEEYKEFLSLIYLDFVSTGVSEKWDLFRYDEEQNEYIVNHDQAFVLFQRTRGKAGLTVEIIRDAICQSLTMGRDYPVEEDYAEVILEGDTILITSEENDDRPDFKPKSRIIVQIDSEKLSCAYEKCKRRTKPYSTIRHLINHYAREHPEAEIRTIYGEPIDKGEN